MARRVKDLIAWQKARELMQRVYAETRVPAFAQDFGLAGHIQRASVSVRSNIAEGFERDRATEFQQFLEIVKGSCGETRPLLDVVPGTSLIDQPTDNPLRQELEEVSPIVAGLRASVARQRIKTAQDRKHSDSRTSNPR